MTDPTQYCSYTNAPPSATINPPTLSAASLSQSSVQTAASRTSGTSASSTQAARRRRAANLLSRALQLGRMTKTGMTVQRAGVSVSQSNGCSVFGPTRNVQTGFNTPGVWCAAACFAQHCVVAC